MQESNFWVTLSTWTPNPLFYHLFFSALIWLILGGLEPARSRNCQCWLLFYSKQGSWELNYHEIWRNSDVHGDVSELNRLVGNHGLICIMDIESTKIFVLFHPELVFYLNSSDIGLILLVLHYFFSKNLYCFLFKILPKVGK